MSADPLVYRTVDRQNITRQQCDDILNGEIVAFNATCEKIKRLAPAAKVDSVIALCRALYKKRSISYLVPSASRSPSAVWEKFFGKAQDELSRPLFDVVRDCLNDVQREKETSWSRRDVLPPLLLNFRLLAIIIELVFAAYRHAHHWDNQPILLLNAPLDKALRTYSDEVLRMRHNFQGFIKSLSEPPASGQLRDYPTIKSQIESDIKKIAVTLETSDPNVHHAKFLGGRAASVSVQVTANELEEWTVPFFLEVKRGIEVLSATLSRAPATRDITSLQAYLVTASNKAQSVLDLVSNLQAREADWSFYIVHGLTRSQLATALLKMDEFLRAHQQVDGGYMRSLGRDVVLSHRQLKVYGRR